MSDFIYAVLVGVPERASLWLYKNGSPLLNYQIKVYGSPGRAIFINDARSHLFFFEASTDKEYDTVCRLDVWSEVVTTRRIASSSWSMCIDPASGTVYCLSLDGTVTAVDLFDQDKETKTTKLEFTDKLCKSAFPSIHYLEGFLFVVGYLKTPKDDDACPNRLFML